MKKIERPAWFTKERYMEYKAQGKMDKEIGEKILFVGAKVMKRFKRELDVVGVSNRGWQNRKIFADGEVKALRDKGHTIKEICEHFGCSKPTIYKELRR